MKGATIHIRINLKEDYISKEILNRCRKKTEFAKEAIFYWDYILRHSNLGTRFLTFEKIERTVIPNLFPELYYKTRTVLDYSNKEEFEDAEVSALRFTVKKDDEALYGILNRCTSYDDFIKEAIFEWDCLLNTSNVFRSRFIKKKNNSTPVWHLPAIQCEQIATIENNTGSQINNESELTTIKSINNDNSTHYELDNAVQTKDIHMYNHYEEHKEHEDYKEHKEHEGHKEHEEIQLPKTENTENPRKVMTRGKKNKMQW